MPDKKLNHALDHGKNRSETATAGKRLRMIFRQDDSLRKIRIQPARESLMMNNARMSIFVHLFSNPGEHTRSIARNTGLNLNSVKHHLARLESAGYVESARIRGKRIYWPKGTVRQEDLELLLMLRNNWAIRTMSILALGGGPMRQVEIMKAMQDSQQVVEARLCRMASANLVHKEGTGKSARYSVHGDLLNIYKRYLVSSKDTAMSVISVLRKDGLMPSEARLRGTRLSVTVYPPGLASRLHLECNPLAPLKMFFHA